MSMNQEKEGPKREFILHPVDWRRSPFAKNMKKIQVGDLVCEGYPTAAKKLSKAVGEEVTLYGIRKILRESVGTYKGIVVKVL